jgi:hypothetical protein
MGALRLPVKTQPLVDADAAPAKPVVRSARLATALVMMRAKATGRFVMVLSCS